MGKAERLELIKKLEKLTDSRIIVYVTGDRRGLETRIASDIFPLIFKHLDKFGHRKKINLFLYTPGGITISGYGLVNLIREYCDEFGVLIPFRALSTGTLIALGANTITMSKMGQLGPVDPSVNHPLGPSAPHPQNPNLKLLVPVNVEDVLSFFELAKNQACANSEKELTEAFKTLSTSIHPLVLGSVNRARDQIKFLAKTLLQYHMKDDKKIEHIVKTLLEQRFSHDYLVGRTEAKNVIGLNIIDAPKEENETMIKLYDEYNMLMKLGSAYNPEEELRGAPEIIAKFHRGIVESTEMTQIFTTVRKIKKVEVNQGGVLVPSHVEQLLEEGWIENTND